MGAPTEPTPMNARESYALREVAKWWEEVCEHAGMPPAEDQHRACLEAAFAYMAECRARAQMPVAPTRIQ